MTAPSNTETYTTEIIINARDDPSKRSLWPDIYATSAKITNISLINPFMSIKKAVPLHFCFQFIAEDNHYIDKPSGAEPMKVTPPLVSTEDKRMMFYYSINIPAGDYTITELIDTIKTKHNLVVSGQGYLKDYKYAFSNSHGMTTLANGGPNGDPGVTDYAFKLKSFLDLTIGEGGLLNWNFKFWNQTDNIHTEVGVYQGMPTFMMGVNTVSGHEVLHRLQGKDMDIYLSSERWLLEKLGLDIAKEGDLLAPNNQVVASYGYKALSANYSQGTTLVVGINDAEGFGSESGSPVMYQKFENIGFACPHIYDLTIGNGVYLCLRNFGDTRHQIYDTRGITNLAVAYVPLKFVPFGSSITYEVNKIIQIGGHILKNNFELFFVDEDSNTVQDRTLNFVVQMTLFSNQNKSFVQ